MKEGRFLSIFTQWIFGCSPRAVLSTLGIRPGRRPKQGGRENWQVNWLRSGFLGGSVVKNLPARWETQVWSLGGEDLWTSLVAQMIRYLPIMRETRVQFLGWEDLLEKEMVTHSSILAWKIPWTEKPCRLQSMGSQRVGHLTEWLSLPFLNIA